MRRPDIDDPNLPLSRIFEQWPGTAGVFLDRRMLCFGCPIAPFHTVIDACAEYGLDEDVIRRELRQAAAEASIPPLR
jgi:hybrid cluster-associated redox disulfide protein